MSVSATKLFVTALRSFLRFCFIEGLTPQRPVRGRALGFPSTRLLAAQGNRPAVAGALVRSCDRRTSKGRRDYAIVLILLRLGCVPARSLACASTTSTAGR